MHEILEIVPHLELTVRDLVSLEIVSWAFSSCCYGSGSGQAHLKKEALEALSCTVSFHFSIKEQERSETHD